MYDFPHRAAVCAGAGAGADARESAADAALSGLLGLLSSRSLAGSQSRVAGLTQWTTCYSIACSSVTKLTLRLRPNTHICHTILSDLTNMLVLFLFHCMYFLPHLSCRGQRDFTTSVYLSGDTNNNK